MRHVQTGTRRVGRGCVKVSGWEGVCQGEWVGRVCVKVC